MNIHPDRVLVVVDDDPERVIGALQALTHQDHAAPGALHVICRSAAVAGSLADALLGRGRRPLLPAACAALGVDDALLFGRRYVHVLGVSPSAAREVDCCLDAIDWLVTFLHMLHRQGYAIDLVAGPAGVVRIALLVSALGVVSSPDDRLWVLRPGGHPRASGAGTRRGARRHASIFEIPYVCATPEQHEHPVPFQDLRTRRGREWSAARQAHRLHVDCARGALVIADVVVRIPTAQLFWYAAVATAPGGAFPLGDLRAALVRDERGRPAIKPGATRERELSALLVRLRALFLAIAPAKGDDFDRLVLNACGEDVPQLASTLAKTGRALKRAVGAGVARPYLARARRGEGVYAIDLPADRITIDPDPCVER